MSRLEPVLGTEIIHDIRLGHTWYEYKILQHFVAIWSAFWEHKTFIEIGVHEGGLSYLLIQQFPELNYLGVEWSCAIVRPKVLALYSDPNISAELYCYDCYSAMMAEKINSIEHKIIYCDGGGKAKELKYFKKFCNYGDILMSHDYHDGVAPVVGVPTESLHLLPKEVIAEDIAHMEEDETFAPVFVPFDGTRIVGWRKL